jgi:lipopolysaccharide transport system ATP-binding protein
MSDSDTVISVESLSKRYLVGHEGPQERYHSLRDSVVRHGKNLLRKTADMAKGNQIIQGDTVEEFWALKDVSFEVKRGEVLGIIGRNGAGKSTLLKILSRITEPTSGRVKMRGRVASLLEVGTGFHPELTGRENIFLNGAILGMSRAEIKSKFDEIVDFAGVARFLDTPVKRYSSGMYVRLAFAVAAHLEPEILIIDEVLAVGDVEFQKKCLGKMEDVAKGGRTVLFVSHNMVSCASLCSVGILLHQGAIKKVGPISEVINQHMTESLVKEGNNVSFYRRHAGDSLKVIGLNLLINDEMASSICSGQDCVIRIKYELSNPFVDPRSIGFAIILNCSGQKLANLWIRANPPLRFPKVNDGLVSGFLDCRIPKWPFRGMRITVDVYSHLGDQVQDWIEDAFHIESADGDFYKSGVITNSDQGVLFMNHAWCFDATN